jgi:hypothetical protein
MDIEREWRVRPPTEPMTDLGAIVRDYVVRFPRERRDMVWEYCRTAPDLKTAILRAVRSRGEDGKMHNHQTRVPEAIREEFGSECRLQRRNIDLTMKSKMDKFDALHDLLDSIKPKGIGPVTLYDVATRIGAFLGVDPTSLYLHAGVREGINLLNDGENGAYFDRKEWSKIERVPQDRLRGIWPEFSALPPDEVEDLLCTYRNAFDFNETLF